MAKVVNMAMAAALLVPIFLTGCTSNKGGTTSGTSTTTPGTSVTPKEELKPVELSWYLPGQSQKDTKLVESEINKYLKDKINVTLKLNFIDWASWADKTSVMIASGENYDIMFTAGWSNYKANVLKGAFVDMTDLLDKYAPKTKALLHPAFLEGSKINGKNYAIPTNKELAHTWGFYYRDDIAKKYNLDMSSVKTFEDMGPIYKTLKEKEPNMILLGSDIKTTLGSILDFDPIGDSNTPGKLYLNRDTKVINEYATPEFKQLLETVHAYYQTGYIRKDAATIKDESPDAKAGKVFSWISSLKPLGNEDWSAGIGYPMGQIELTKPFITGNDTQGSMQAISRISKNPERAMMFLELVNTDKTLNNLLNYGIENKHYVKKSDNVIDFAPGLDAKTSGYFPSANWIFGNNYLNYFMSGQNTSKWDKYKAFNDAGTKSKILGFDFNQEPVKTEIAACANVSAEFQAGLYTGTLDPEINLPKFLDKLKQAGVDKIIAEKQKQLDDWLATKK